jgi:lipocalin-like protein
MKGSIAYSGTYAVSGKTLIFNVEASTYPNAEGTQQKRTITVTADELRYFNPSPTMGGTAEVNGNADARLCIDWQETGGPSVQTSERSGYGMEVIRGLFPYELEGEVDFAFATEGVRCRFSVPLSRLTGGDRRVDTFEDGLAPTDSAIARFAG